MQAVIYPQDCLFVCIDIQERLLPLMAYKDLVIKNTNILLQGAKILGIKTLITEQYPKGLGNTHNAIDIQGTTAVLEKTSFGIFGDENIKAFIAQYSFKYLVLFGIESHICVLQTAIEAQNAGYQCILIADALSSRSETNHALALDFFSTQGMSVLPTESILFRILGDSQHAQFKTISRLIK